MKGFRPVISRDAGGHLLSHTVSSVVPSAAQVLTIVFGMGTGVTPARIATSKICCPLATQQQSEPEVRISAALAS